MHDLVVSGRRPTSRRCPSPPFRNEMHYDGAVFENVDWSERGEYMRRRHGITPAIANDALADADRVVINPDYNSESGRSVRIVGYSVMADEIVTVIVLEDSGTEYGVNGWASNAKDRRIYGGVEIGGVDERKDQ